MGHQYGTLTWGTIGAPELFSGEIVNYSFEKMRQETLEEDAAGENMALILDRPKGELSFEVKITDESIDYLNLATGAAIAVTGEAEITGGVVLVQRAVEKWRVGAAKTAAISATWYPDVVQSSPASVGTMSAFTPSQTGLTIVTPAAKIVYGTFGMSHAAGIIQSLEIEQQWTLSDGEPTPDGKIVGVLASGYQRRIRLEMLATGAMPTEGSTLAITGAPAHAGGYKIMRSRKVQAVRRAKLYSVEALWLPLFT